MEGLGYTEFDTIYSCSWHCAILLLDMGVECLELDALPLLVPFSFAHGPLWWELLGHIGKKERCIRSQKGSGPVECRSFPPGVL